jgi:hypothetical protein
MRGEGEGWERNRMEGKGRGEEGREKGRGGGGKGGREGDGRPCGRAPQIFGLEPPLIYRDTLYCIQFIYNVTWS